MYEYPYGNAQQLNLDWIINKIKELQNAVTDESGVILEEISNSLIAITYDSAASYELNDIVYNAESEKLYKCISPANAELWDDTHWEEIMVGSVLTELLNKCNWIIPQQFGAVGDGVTDDTAAFIKMAFIINNSRTINTILLPEGKYVLSNDITISKDCNIIGSKAEIIVTGNHSIIFTGAASSIGKTTAAAAIHDTKISTNISTDIDTEKVYLIYNTTDNSWSSERAYYRQGEFIKVLKNNNNTFYLGKSLDDLYPTSCNIIEISPIQVNINNVKFTSVNANSSHLGIVIVKFGRNCTVKNCIFNDSPYSLLLFNNTCDSKIENCIGVSIKGTNNGTNYGVSILSCNNITITDCCFFTWRHGFTIGNGQYPIPARYIKFIRCCSVAYDHVNSEINNISHTEGVTGFDSHANAEFITWTDCKGDSINNDASNSIVENCTFTAIGSYCPVYNWYQVRGYTKFINCNVFGWNGTTSIYYNCRLRRTDISPDFNLVLKGCYIEKLITNTFETVITYKKWVDIINCKLPEGVSFGRTFPAEKAMITGNDAKFIAIKQAYGGLHLVNKNNSGYIEVSGGSTSFRADSIITENRIYRTETARSPIITEHCNKGIISNNIIDVELPSNVTGIIQAVDAVLIIVCQNIFNINTNSYSITIEYIDHRNLVTLLTADNNIWDIDNTIVNYTPT